MCETSYRFLVRFRPFNKQEDASREAVHVFLMASPVS